MHQEVLGPIEGVRVIEDQSVHDDEPTQWLVVHTEGPGSPKKIEVTENGVEHLRDALDSIGASEGSGKLHPGDVDPGHPLYEVQEVQQRDDWVGEISMRIDEGFVEVEIEEEKPQPGEYINPNDPHEW